MDGDPLPLQRPDILGMLVDAMKSDEVDTPALLQEEANQVVEPTAAGVAVLLWHGIRDDECLSLCQACTRPRPRWASSAQESAPMELGRRLCSLSAAA